MSILILYMGTWRHREVSLSQIHTLRKGQGWDWNQVGSRAWALNHLIMLIKWIIISLHPYLSFLSCDSFSPLIHSSSRGWMMSFSRCAKTLFPWVGGCFVLVQGPHPCLHIRFLQGTGKKYCLALRESFCPDSTRPRGSGGPCMGSFREHPGWFCTQDWQSWV